LEEAQIVRLQDKNEFLLPGLIDTHIHAAQFPNNGKPPFSDDFEVYVCGSSTRASICSVDECCLFVCNSVGNCKLYLH
jgi:adenine deaminase